MIRKAFISLALVAWPLGAPALSIMAVPDCFEEGVEYLVSDALADGLLYAEAFEPDSRVEYELLVLCQARQAVRADFVGPYQMGFFELSDKLAQSDETYTLDDVAKLAREIGYDARVLPFSSASCVCNLGR